MVDQRWVLIVRVWWEHDPQLAAPVLRGSLQQLGSELLQYFTSLEVLPELVRAALPITPLDSGDDPPTAVP